MTVSIQKVTGKCIQIHFCFKIFNFYNREEYVSMLEKHIQIDIYGKCGTLKCTPKNVSSNTSYISDTYLMTFFVLGWPELFIFLSRKLQIHSSFRISIVY